VATASVPRIAARVGRPPDGFRTVTTVVSLVAPVVLIAILIVVGVASLPAIQRFGPGFLLSRTWNPVKDDFGALPFVYGTLVSSFLALAMALPVGVGVAVFLAEQGLPALRGAISLGVELLAAIPSVVYGIWGLYVLAPWLLTHVSQPLQTRFGNVVIFGGPARQANLLIAAIVVAVMILPTLASISREVIRAVPNGLREASVAMGATWWETIWRVVLPAARAGIFGATVLSLGRALGETMAVAMVIGNTPAITGSLLTPAATMAGVIANEFREATTAVYQASLIELGLILMLVTLIVNVLALLLVRSVSREARI
jgi:phosphate transport system permease protein